MTRSILLFSLMIFQYPVNCQEENDNYTDEDEIATSDTIHSKKDSLSIASSWMKPGSVDLISGGLLRSGARLLTLRMGKEGKINLPFYIMIGASTDFSDEVDNSRNLIMSDLLLNNGGYLNFGFAGNIPLSKSSNSFSVPFQLGAKSISTVVYEQAESVNFISYIILCGLQFDTDTWIDGAHNKKGKAWLKAYFSTSKNKAEALYNLFGSEMNSICYGANVEGGIVIKDHINVKFSYSKYLNNQHIEVFGKGIYMLSLFMNK